MPLILMLSTLLSTFLVNGAEINSKTINNIIREEKRFILFNSRRLTGECLAVCQDDQSTKFPTMTPTLSPVLNLVVDLTNAPVVDPTNAPVVDPTLSPSKSPTKSPTDSPSASPTKSPTADPTESPSKNPTKNPTSLPAPTDSPTQVLDLIVEGGSCLCPVNSKDEQTWKCGNDVYVCPGVETICSTTGSQNSVYYDITQDECDDMKLIEIGSKCIKLLPDRITKPKALSNRVCYNSSSEHGMKEDGSCDFCNDSVPKDQYKTWTPMRK